ncbi:ankyrin [Lentithecium fluviatile CBS 122367]|uniref:Ankyrin n=1 Tax=Lentithecium fluviatile CBS 122367 TaxID=1168545 RepID=A0A6G1IJ19_9PLEO|nr:ankyrin [Lentithecium fluviatile CBS 122367]
MDSTPRARKIDEATWERHRSTIERLYVTEDKQLEGKDGVIVIMTKGHAFTASKSQYETRFKVWKIRKNVKRNEWPPILKKVRKRKRLGKDSEVTLNGTVISKERIEREISRYGLTEGRQGEVQGFSPNIPGDVAIHTPPSVFDTGDLSEAMSLSPMGPHFHSFERRPQHGGMSTQNATQSNYRDRETSTVILAQNHLQPFSWANTLDWDVISQLTSPMRQMIKLSVPSPTQANAIFYPMQQGSGNPDYQNAIPLFPRYLVSCLVNGTDIPGGLKIDDIHRWLRNIPHSTLAQFFKMVPASIMDILREKIFAAAVYDGDENTVKAMLELGVDPRDNIAVEMGEAKDPSSPLQIALSRRHFSVAEILVKYISQKANRLELEALLRQILHEQGLPYYLEYGTDFTDRDWSALIRIPLSAGASPTVTCFRVAKSDEHLTRQLLEMREGGVNGWLRDGLLRDSIHCVWTPNQSFFRKEKYQPLIRWVLSYFLLENAHEIATDDPQAKIALSNAFQAALEEAHKWATETLFEACSKLGIHLEYLKYGEAAGNAIIQACHEADWGLALQLVHTHKQQQKIPPGHYFTHGKSESMTLLEAVSEDDLNYIKSRMEQKSSGWVGWDPILEKAAELGHDRIAIEIARSKANVLWRAPLILLQYGRTAAISTLVFSDKRWSIPLSYARFEGDYTKLDDLLYRTQTLQEEPGFPGGLWLRSSIDEQIALRALSYHAIQTKDSTLMKWLLEAGLDVDECCWTVLDVGEGPLMLFKPSSIGGRILPSTARAVGHLPSLLAIAAEKNDRAMIRFLLAEGAKIVDTFALMRAVSSNADTATIELLLDASDDKQSSKKKQYGSDALRNAIRLSDYDMLRLLAARTDINGLELVVEMDPKEPRSLSPLGEAILQRDLEAARILLGSGADPDTLVAYGGIANDSPAATSTILRRLCPLLAAIDTANLPMVQLLVQHGAAVDYPPKLGLLRTPLQRAAEIGNFELVQYLLDQWAPVDSAPFYSGGTPLQLAAIGGYVGVATLLLERGADPNYPPAEGEGRTAFEAAAEWGRVDTMTLLVQRGVDLDLAVGDNADDRQYERAVRFAEKRGQMASKRFVQDLFRQVYGASWEDF